jgi:predicted nucleic acid-binding Zn finger protein
LSADTPLTNPRGGAAVRLLQLERLIRPLGDNTFEVQSEAHPERCYLVTLPSGSCTCPDWMQRCRFAGADCKHILAVRMCYPEGSV